MQLKLQGPGCRQRGGTLVETMVAVIVICFGLINLVAAHGGALVYQRQASQHIAATQAALALVEHVRSNTAAFQANRYVWDKQYGSTQLPAGVTCGASAPCTNDQVAQLDLGAWLRDVRSGLPEGDGYVSSESTNGLVDAWVMWKPAAGAGGPANSGACPLPAVAHLAEADRPMCVHVRARIS